MKLKDKYRVSSINARDTHDWLLHKHYAKRIPSISWAFGLFDDYMQGVCTFGKPASPKLRTGIAGDSCADMVYELNRLVINEWCKKNTASFFISKCLKKLPKGLILVSYADIGQGHVGKIYQATNWIYTGLSAKRTDWKIRGMEHLHGQTIADKTRGMKNRARYMRDKYGDDFYLEERSSKHRYVYFTGKKYDLNYPVMPYPKGDSKRYDASYKPQVQTSLF